MVVVESEDVYNSMYIKSIPKVCDPSTKPCSYLCDCRVISRPQHK